VLTTLRSPFTLSVLVAVPLAALLVFGFILSTEVSGLRIGILDSDHTPASRRLVADLTAKGTFVAVPFTDRTALEDAMVDGDVSAGMIIRPTSTAASATRTATTRRRCRCCTTAPRPCWPATRRVPARTGPGNAPNVITQHADRAAPRRARRSGCHPGPVQPDSRRQAVHGVGTFGFVLTFLTVLLTAVSIVNEKLTALRAAAGDSGQRPGNLLGKILPLGAVFTADVVLMFTVAGFALGVWPAGSAVFSLPCRPSTSSCRWRWG